MTATVEETIALTIEQTTLNLGTITDGMNSGAITATVATNADGYDLTMAAVENTYMSGTSGGHQIPTLGDDITTVAAGTSAWGYKGGSKTDWAAIPAASSPDTLKSGSTTAGEATEVTFGVSIAANQAADTYTGKVTFTATAK